MQNKIICDTNVISDYFEGKISIVEKINNIGFDNIIITPVIRIELMRWLSLYKVEKSKRMKILKIIKNFFSISTCELLSNEPPVMAVFFMQKMNKNKKKQIKK